MNEFKCNYCIKSYKSYASLNNHYSIKHREAHKNVMTDKNNQEKIYKCSTCKLQLNSRTTKYRHELKCKQMMILEEEIKKNTQISMETIIKEKDAKFALLVKENEIYRKMLMESKQNINNGTIVNGTLNNGPVVYNNTINVVKFGSEELKDIFTKDEILKILNRKKLSLEQSIEMLHLNKGKPEYKNIFITNLKDDYAYVYDGDKFIAAYKTEILNDIIENHSYNIETSMEEYKDKITSKTYDVLQKFIDMLNDETTEFYAETQNKKYNNYKEYKKDMIKLLIYNNTYMDSNLISVIYE